MSRASYEGNTSIVISEGTGRTGYYFLETHLCSINTEHTISSLVQKDLQENNRAKDLQGIIGQVGENVGYQRLEELDNIQYS